MPWEKSFDTDEALARAADVFHTFGYEATSMTKLLESMGIQKGSFYATYGSKREVFIAALERYVSKWGVNFERARAGQSPRAFLIAQMEDTAEACKGRAAARGCFLVNTAIELGPHDAEIKKFCRKAMAAHAGLFEALIKEGQAAGEIDAGLDPHATAQMLLSVRVGLRVMGRSGLGAEVARAAVDRAIALLESA